MEARLTAGVSERMLDVAALMPGERVLDLASGMGEPALRAARRVGPGGRVLGVDVSDASLEEARTVAAREGLRQLELRTGDATALEVEAGTFDVVTCRWGLMYMQDPERALAHARRALVPGGRLVVACWAEPERVPYATLPRRVLARYTDLAPEHDDAPGVFRHADAARFEALLARAGFRVLPRGLVGGKASRLVGGHQRW